MTISTTNILLDAALAYVARGWCVVALHTPEPGGCSCGKSGCDSIGKHPRWDAQLLPNGLKNATTDPGIIRVWWALWPDANIGVATGTRSGLWALDKDIDTGGDLSLEQILAQHGPLPETPEQLTGSGGSHYLFAHPGGKVGNRVRFAPGLDTRGDGGYIVAAPSRNANGAYAWVVSPDDAPLAPAPAWLLALVAPAPKAAPAPPPPPINLNGNGHAALPPRTLHYVLHGAPQGSRNAELYAAAQQFYAAGYTQAEADQRLRPRALSDGLPDSEIDKTIASAYQSQQVHAPASAPGSNTTNTPGAPPPTTRGSALITAHHTDAGNAECLVELFGDDMRFCHTRGKWLVWDGLRWEIDDLGEAQRRALETVHTRYHTATQQGGLQQHASLARWAIASESTGRIRALLESASTRKECATKIGQYDSHAFLAGTLNGTLDLQTGACRAPDRFEYLTMRLNTTYDDQAGCPRWEQFLTEVFGGDQSLIDWVQRAVGYTLTGDTREEVLFLCFGSGANGKSKFLEVLSRLLGDYAATASFETFNAERRSEQTNDLAALAGKRLVTAIETDEDRRLAEARVKMVTGGDTISCRFLRQEFFSYRPQFKVWLAMNHKPIVRGRDRGIWRRIKLIPFLQSFERKPDKQLNDKLAAEMPGILNWAIQGLLAWHQQGLGTCAAIDAATEGYRKEMDDIGQWIDEELVDDIRAIMPATDGYAHYNLWARNRGERFPRTMHIWGRVMKEHGYTSSREMVSNRKITVYHEIRIRATGDP